MVWVLAEKFKVLAVIKHVEELLVLTGSIQVRAQPRATPHHLPELGFGPNHLEEHQIDDLRHVDAGVQHVHRNSDVRHALLGGELVNQALRVFGLVGHHAGKMTVVVRVVEVEALGNELGVGVVLGKHDGLAKAVATGHLFATGHQVL